MHIHHMLGDRLDGRHFFQYVGDIVTSEVTIHLTMTVAMFVIIATVCVMLSFLHGTAKVRICTPTRA